MHIKYWAIAAAIAASCGTATAAQSAVDFEVLLTIGESCTFGAKVTENNVNFGSKPRATSTVKYEAEGKLYIDCSEGTEYYIGLNGGANVPAADKLDPGLGVRQMSNGVTGPGAVYVKYDLFQDSGRTKFWGNVKANGKGGTGLGKPDPISVYGLVTNANVAAGSYKDTVTATIYY